MPNEGQREAAAALRGTEEFIRTAAARGPFNDGNIMMGLFHEDALVHDIE